MEFVSYQSVKFASSAQVALIGGILRFGTYNMVILSLFDGMSCGQIALRELGVTIDKYYASEIDKYYASEIDKFAIQNTMANFPDTVQLGDEKYFLSPEYVEKLLAYNKRQEENGNGFKAIFHKETDKMCTLTVGGRSVKDLICVAQRGRSYRGEPQHFEESPNPGKTNCLTTVAKDNLIMQRPRGKNKGAINTEKSPTLSANSWQQNNLLVSKPKDGIRQINPSRESGGTQPYQQNRVYAADGKSPALMNGHGGQTINALVGGAASQTINTDRVRPTANYTRVV